MRAWAALGLLTVACASAGAGVVRPTEAWCPAGRELDVARHPGSYSGKDARLLAALGATHTVAVGCSLGANRSEGVVTFWDDRTGRLTGLVVIANGVLHGPALSWHENGTLASGSVYLDGKSNGRATAWHPNGAVATESTWRDGWLEGPWARFDESGRQTASGIAERPDAGAE
jgi:hypothetical protein